MRKLIIFSIIVLAAGVSFYYLKPAILPGTNIEGSSKDGSLLEKFKQLFKPAAEKPSGEKDKIDQGPEPMGVRTDIKCYFCVNGRFPCIRCKGTGYPLLSKCPKCGGSLTFDYDKKTKSTARYCRICKRKITEKDNVGAKCPVCKGLGHTKCMACLGTGSYYERQAGSMEVDKQQQLTKNPRANNIKCPSCHGTGYMKEVICPLCGKIIERKIIKKRPAPEYYCERDVYLISRGNIPCPNCDGKGRAYNSQ